MSNVQCLFWLTDSGAFKLVSRPRKPADRTLDIGHWTSDLGLWTLDFGLWTLDFGLTKNMSDRVNIPIEETRSYHISAGGASSITRHSFDNSGSRRCSRRLSFNFSKAAR